MIAQLSHSDPFGSPSSSSSGVSVAGSFARNSGLALVPPHVHLVEVEPGGSDEDPSGEVVDARLQDAQRVVRHVRSTACFQVACESAMARWWTQPGSVGVRSGSPLRSSSVKIGDQAAVAGSK